MSVPFLSGLERQSLKVPWLSLADPNLCLSRSMPASLEPILGMSHSSHYPGGAAFPCHRGMPYLGPALKHTLCHVGRVRGGSDSGHESRALDRVLRHLGKEAKGRTKGRRRAILPVRGRGPLIVKGHRGGATKHSWV